MECHCEDETYGYDTSWRTSWCVERRAGCISDLGLAIPQSVVFTEMVSFDFPVRFIEITFREDIPSIQWPIMVVSSLRAMCVNENTRDSLPGMHPSIIKQGTGILFVSRNIKSAP
jgi:hypothetical protein